MNTVLEIRDLSCKVNQTSLLKDIHLKVMQGQWVAIIGPNGAGKSSLLKTLMQDLPISQGQISLFNRTLSDWPAQEKACRMAYLPQSSSLDFPYLVEEVVALGRSPHQTGKTLDQHIIEQSMLAVDVLNYRDQVYTSLSGGEKQRVHLARVLCQLGCSEENGLLLLDEPLNALDLRHQQTLLKLIRQKTQNGLTVMMVVHDLNIALRYADYVIVLHEGELIKEGAPVNVIQPPLLKTVFQIDACIQASEAGEPWICVL